MGFNVEKLLSEVPGDAVLYAVSPPAARKFGVLPVNVRRNGDSGEILDVIGLEGVDEVSETAASQIFRRSINYLRKVGEVEWEKAYNLFYQEFL